MSQETKDLISRKKKGKRVSIRTEFKKGQTTGDKNNNWKGNDVGYFALHGWVYRRLGKAKKCSKCGSEKNVEWANKSHKYKRIIGDWLELCKKCHVKYDSGKHWGRASRKYNL